MRNVKVSIEEGGSSSVRLSRQYQVSIVQGQPLNSYEMGEVHKMVGWLLRQIAGPDIEVTIAWPRYGE